MGPEDRGGRPAWTGLLLGLLVFVGTALAVRLVRERLGVSIAPLVLVGALLLAVAVALARRR